MASQNVGNSQCCEVAKVCCSVASLATQVTPRKAAGKIKEVPSGGTVTALRQMTKHHTAESYPKSLQDILNSSNKPHYHTEKLSAVNRQFLHQLCASKVHFMLHVPGRVAGSCPRPHTEQCNACLEEIISTVMSRIKHIHCWKKIHQKACEGSHGKPRSTNPWRCKFFLNSHSQNPQKWGKLAKKYENHRSKGGNPRK